MTSALREHIRGLKDRVVRPPGGLLKYSYIIPTAGRDDGALDRQHGFYAQQYDWDCFFEGVALTYDGPEGGAALRDAMRNFLLFTTPAGFTPRTLSPAKFFDWPDQMKPFLAQGCLLASRSLGAASWLSEDEYAKLAANLGYWESNRMGGHGLYMWRSSMESGVDNNAASVNTPDLSVESVDLNAYLVREFKAMAAIARERGRAADASSWAAKAEELARRINLVLWDERDGCYYNVWSVADEARAFVRVKSWTSLTPLWAGVATPEIAARLVEGQLLDPKVFWGPFGVPSLARSEPVYNQGRRALIFIHAENRRWEVSNWQGPVWVVANWVAMHGLLRYGYRAEARSLAATITGLLERDVEATGGMHENYDAETGAGLWAPDFGSWNMLAARMAEEAESGRDPASVD
jgi:hypothetical protein